MNKKIISLLLAVLASIIYNNVYATDFTVNVENIEKPIDGVVNLYENYYKFSYEGTEYYFNRLYDSKPQIYNEKEFDFFIKSEGMTTYKKVNNNTYMAVYNCAPYTKVFEGGDSWKGYNDFQLKFYDNEFNLISEHEIGGYIELFGYNGENYYYIAYGGERVYKQITSDMINWSDTTSVNAPPVEKNQNEYIYKCYKGKEYISFDDGTEFYEIAGENNLKSSGYSTDIPFVVKDNSPECSYLSLDCVNYVSIRLDDLDLPERPDIGAYTIPIKCFYATDQYYILETETQRMTIPMSEIKQELNSLKSVPYINLNGKLLAFEVSPTIEDGSTLVPMRFLFEQMGADVSWDNETRTAEVSKEGDVISFSIDNTEASVNGSLKTMDVPARLINDKTMIPIRFLSENLGYTVNWDGDSRMVTITAE